MLTLTFTGETLKDLITQATTFVTIATPKDAAAAAKPVTATVVKTETSKPPSTEEQDAASPEEMKERALEMLRDVCAGGKEGRRKAQMIAGYFKVKKLGDVPAEKAAELLSLASVADEQDEDALVALIEELQS